MFSAQVRGVISLRKFPLPEYDILPENVLPVVFLGYHLFPYGSCVALDLDAGFFRLTREVIQHGHRRIVLVPREFEPVGEMALIASGFERAMNEAGLPIDRQASEDAEGIASDAWQKARAFLQAHVDPKGPKGRQAATALVCAEYGQALCLIGVADLMGIRVPRDLSVVCMLSGPMRLQKPNQHVTGIEFDLDLMVRMGFEVLEEQIRTRRNSISQVRVKPVIERGDSLAPPRLASGE
ncbi:MAG: DNA-binding transcriptional repressor PurR [candidate division BRC1 bacterium ADurb.BinA364]|nr:MAG: DNA-binding transcriptional repressor PurR [candidate division BRC1 bacterium ADurb.BinA364]